MKWLVVLAIQGVVGSPFNWKPCLEKPDPLAECGFLTVPLDHLDESNKASIDIAVRRYRSTSPNRKGTMLVNPGGPGGSGFMLASKSVSVLTGGEYDILGFDPRGIGRSKAALCTKSKYSGTVETRKLNARAIPFEEIGGETSLERYEIEYEVLAKRCERYDSEYLKYLSTSYVARDMDLIRAALGQDVLNYYGISYGTFLGATYVNMFPERVGRVVIDSVLDPALYLGSTPFLMSQSLNSTEAVFEGFCDACEEAGPLHCPLADTQAQRPYLSSRLRNYFAKLDRKPLIVSTGNDWTTVTSTEIRKKLFNYLTTPLAWPKAAIYLHNYINGSAVQKPVASSCTSDKVDYTGSEIEWGIYVSNDGNNSMTNPGDWEAHLKKSQATSPLFGGSWYVPCLLARFWTTEPVEKYIGPWNNTLRNPILILNNHFDPETPLASARAVAAAMGPSNSVLVTRDGYGHGTFGHPSKCLHDIFISFLNDGVLPKPNTNCGVDGNPFIPQVKNVHEPFDRVKEAMKEFSASRTSKSYTIDSVTTDNQKETSSVWMRFFNHAYSILSMVTEI